MENELYKQLMSYGGAAAVIVGLIFLIREIGRVWSARRNGNSQSDVSKRLKKIEDNDLHHLHELQKRMDEIYNKVENLRTEFYVFKQKVTDKIFNIN